MALCRTDAKLSLRHVKAAALPWGWGEWNFGLLREGKQQDGRQNENVAFVW
jgi:hypothetical protein